MAKNMAKGGRDNYPTPQIYAEWAVERVRDIYAANQGTSGKEPRYFLEPGCGAHAPFASAFSKHAYEGCVGVELEPFKALAAPGVSQFMGTNFLDPGQDAIWMPALAQNFDIIATNPPFSCCEAIIEKSLSLLAPDGVMAFLLRMAVTGSKKRLDLWKNNMPLEIAQFVRRISFDGIGTDYAEYALFFWVGSDLRKRYTNQGEFRTTFYLVNNTSAGRGKPMELTTIGMPEL